LLLRAAITRAALATVRGGLARAVPPSSSVAAVAMTLSSAGIDLRLDAEATAALDRASAWRDA
jgi:hypothetical protein